MHKINLTPLIGWFLQPGPLHLIIWRTATNQSHCITIHQQLPSQPVVAARLVPLIVQTLTQDRTKLAVVLNSIDEEICWRKDEIFIVDPEAHTPTRKIYTAAEYRRILEANQENATILTENQLQNLIHDFCNALRLDLLPATNESLETSIQDWIDV